MTTLWCDRRYLSVPLAVNVVLLPQPHAAETSFQNVTKGDLCQTCFCFNNLTLYSRTGFLLSNTKEISTVAPSEV